MLAACAAEEQIDRGTNPSTLWFAMNSSRTGMVLSTEEPKPY
jgi:hypothetical protein